jgi:Domain of unknown function (DUF4157)
MRAIVLSLAIAMSPGPALSGGLLGDALSGAGNLVAPGSNIGKPLDDMNRNLKKQVPAYGNIEEGASAAARQLSREALVEHAGPALAAMIQASRNDTLRGGVQDVPPQVRQIMSRFFGNDIAAGVRYRIGQGGDLALASNAFRYGDALAITLVDLIVFRDGAVFNDLSLWAHELYHVAQYRSWGLLDFAKRYVRDHEAVENEAYATQARFRAWAPANLSNFGTSPPTTMPMPPMPRLSSVCGTQFGMCAIPAVGPVGAGCWCASARGPINGQLVPQ